MATDSELDAQIDAELTAAIKGQLPASESRGGSLDPKSGRAVSFDPTTRTMRVQVDDPLFDAINNLWRDKSQHGRIVYESMIRHPAVSGPYRALIQYLKTYKPNVVPSAKEPSEKQKEIADFAASQLKRLGADGDPSQGYGKFMEGAYGGALLYGFTLSEVGTVWAPWKGENRVQYEKIRVLPQATLDNGYVPREDYGEIGLPMDSRYTCFTFDKKGRGDVVGFKQFGFRRDDNQVKWTARSKDRIIHATHGGADGSPYGESLLYSAFYAWSSLYVLEQLEEVFLDNALPYLTASYKTPDGRPSADLHAEMIEIVSKQDPANRLLIGPDMMFGSAAPSNENFTRHVEAKKKELRNYISQALLVPNSVYSSTDESEGDARNLIQVFFKYIAPAYLDEWSNVLKWQVLKRIIDANYPDLSLEDYPDVSFSTILDNDLRVMQTMFAQLLPYTDADKLGEFAQSMIPHFKPDWIPVKHEDSVEIKRPRRDSNDEPNNVNGVSNPPPPKEDGETRQRQDGQTDNPSGTVDTVS